jgi:ribose transport system permease protein
MSSAEPGPPVDSPQPAYASTTAVKAVMTKPVKRRGRGYASRYGLIITFVLVVAFFWIQRPDVFSQLTTWQGILNASALPAIIAMGLTVTLIAGDFDLSIGATVGLAMAITAASTVYLGWPWPIAALVALLVGILLGLLNGFLVALLGVNSFIATLAVSSIIEGLDANISKQQTISTGIPADLVALGAARFGGFNVAVLVAIVVAAVLYVLVAHTETGRYMYASGGNREAARLAGVRVRWLRTVGLILSALGAALVGILLVAQTSSYYPNAGGGYLLPAYAAAFLGTALGGGRFGILATAFGVIFLQTLQTGLTVLNVEPWVVLVVQGTVLALAVVVSTWQGKLKLPLFLRRA